LGRFAAAFDAIFCPLLYDSEIVCSAVSTIRGTHRVVRRGTGF